MQKFFLLLFFTFFISGPVSAEISVLFSTLDGDLNKPLYEYEAREFLMRVTNTSSVDAQNFEVLLNAPPELSLPLDFEEKNQRHFTFLILKAGEAQERYFAVKPVSSSKKEVELRAEYAEGLLRNSSVIKINVLPSPIAVHSLLQGDPLSFTNSGKMRVNLTNSSTGELKSLRVEMVSSNNSPAQYFEFPSLLPGHSTSEKEFRFSQPLGTRVALRVLFEDSNRRHVIERPVPIAVTQKDFLAGTMVAFVALLVLLVFFGGRLWSKQRPHGSAHPKKHDSGR